MVNNLVPPTSESSNSISLHLPSSSSVSNNGHQTHPSINKEDSSNHGINIKKHYRKFNANHINARNVPLNDKFSHQGDHIKSPHNHYHDTMAGGALIVDLLSAFGLLHNISVHEPNVVLRPGPHSAAPAAVFAFPTTLIPGTSPRNVRLDLNDIENWDSVSSRYRSRSASSEVRDNRNAQNKLFNFNH